MIDYDTQDDDPIVAEVRRAREELLVEHNYDLRAIFEAYQRRQAAAQGRYASPGQRSSKSQAAQAKKAG